MSLLAQLTAAIGDGSIEVVDLTAPLSETTPILQLPEPFGNTVNFSLREISRYDDRGPAWYWNDIVTGEHTGTHFDAPVHWITGRDGEDVSQVAPRRLVAPAVVLDVADRVAGDPDFLLEIDDVQATGSRANGPLPDGGWLLYRTGWDARSDDQEEFLNADESGSHTPGHLRRVRDAGWPRRHRSSGSAWRRSAPTRAAPPGSTRRSRAIRSCSARASTA